MTPEDLLRLEAFLKKEPIAETAMSVSMIDGMMTATVIGPSPVMPSDYLQWIWDTEEGEIEAPFDSQEAAGEILGIVMGMQNRIATSLMKEPPQYRPLFASDERLSHTDWARGFDIGTTFDPAWDELLHANSGEDEPEDFPSLAALTMLSHPDVRQIIGDQWPRLLDELESMVVDVRDMFRAQAVEAGPGFVVQQPFVRPGPKVGRNDPCPCGSGRKYKKCCGDGTGTVH